MKDLEAMIVEPLREMMTAWGQPGLAAAGLVIGFVFGWIVYATHFCAMGGISDMMTFGDTRRFRAWVLAAATATFGTTLLSASGLVDLEKSLYLAPTFNLFGHVAGGLLFGFGMVYAGGCSSKNVVRAGSGDLRALLTLIVLGVTAFATIGGILGPARDGLARATSIDLAQAGVAHQGLDALAAKTLGAAPGDLHLWVGVLVAAVLAAYCFASEPFRRSRRHVGSGLGVGLCVVAGWLVTGLAFDEFAAVQTASQSLSFVRPTGDALDWLQRFTALGWPGFGAATIFGCLAGALAAALARGTFKIQTFSNAADTKRNLFGGVLMGVGGVFALGCTIGQAVTGVSTLALGGIVTFAAIIAGGILGLWSLERAVLRDA